MNHPFEGLYDYDMRHLVGQGAPFQDALKVRDRSVIVGGDLADPNRLLSMYFMLPLDGSAIPIGALGWMTDAVLMGRTVALFGVNDEAIQKARETIEEAVRGRATAEPSPETTAQDQRLDGVVEFQKRQQAQIRALSMLVGALMAALQRNGGLEPEMSEAIHNYAASGVACVPAASASWWGSILSLARADEAEAAGTNPAPVLQ